MDSKTCSLMATESKSGVSAGDYETCTGTNPMIEKEVKMKS